MKGDHWVNGDIINGYFKLIGQQSKYKIYSVDSFVFERFSENQDRIYKRKKNLFNFDIVFFPINVNRNHWAFIKLSVENQSFLYYDSMLTTEDNVVTQCKIAKKFIEAMFTFSDLNISQWHCQNVANTPKQIDISSCGVYTCQNAKCISRGESFSISPSKIPNLRKEMVAEISLGFLFS